VHSASIYIYICILLCVKTANNNILENVFGSLFFAYRTVSSIVNVDMLKEFLMPILEEEGPDDMLFQHGGAPPHLRLK
jgi:hypothetical protein